jgi:hypothetical protein
MSAAVFDVFKQTARAGIVPNGRYPSANVAVGESVFAEYAHAGIFAYASFAAASAVRR